MEPRERKAPDLKAVARADGRMVLAGAPEGYDALIMADVARMRGGLSCFVARDGARAEAFVAAMGFFAPSFSQFLRQLCASEEQPINKS